MIHSNVVRVAALAAGALGLLAAEASAGWDGGKACQSIPNCEPVVLDVEADEPPEAHRSFSDPHGTMVAVMCPNARPHVWIRPGHDQGIGWDTHHLSGSPDVRVDSVRPVNLRAAVFFEITWSGAQKVSVAAGCTSVTPATTCDPVTAITPGDPIELRLTCQGAVSGVVLGSRPKHGSLSPLRRDGTANPNATVTYTPDPGYFGPDSFVYTAYGPNGTAGAVPVTLSVRWAPVCRDDSVADVGYGTTRTFALPCIGAIERYVVVRGPTRGTLSAPGPDGTVTYTAPASGKPALDFMSIQAIGPEGTSTTASVAVQLVPGGPPVPVDR